MGVCKVVVATAAVLGLFVSEAGAAGARDVMRYREKRSGKVVFLRNRRTPHLRAEVRRVVRARAAVSSAYAQRRAEVFLRRNGRFLGVRDWRRELRFAGLRSDDVGMYHLSYRQQASAGGVEVPVYGAEVRVHVKPDGVVSSANGRIVRGVGQFPAPVVGAEEAEAIARQLFLDEFGAEASVAESVVLYVLSRGLIEAAGSGASQDESQDKLVWVVHLSRLERTPSGMEYYFIDALTGELVLQLTGARHIERKIYDCSPGWFTGDTLCWLNKTFSQYPGYYFGRGEGRPPRGPCPVPGIHYGQTDVDKVYGLMGSIHDYLWVRHGRNGANGVGGLGDGVRYPLSVTAVFVYTEAVGDNCEGTVAVAYGNTLSFCFGGAVLDIAGHEYGHCVLDHAMVARWGGAVDNYPMVYYGEPGSLHENFASVFGEAVEHYVTGNGDWIEGTDVYNGPIRNLADPHSMLAYFGDPWPDRFHDAYVYCGTENRGGVHINGTVVSKAAYLTAMGGTHNGCVINGIGRTKEEKIWFRAATEYYTPTETFNGAYALFLQACGDLYAGEDCDELRKALQSVELDQPGKCSGLPGSVPACATGSASVVGRHIFYNNSKFDGETAGADALDDGAVAVDKSPLLPGGAARFANYSSYSRGLNGVMVDIAGSANAYSISGADFEFKVGNNSVPSGWSDAPAPVSVTVRLGAGVGGSDRVTIIWADGAVKNKWLRVKVLPTTNTRLGAADVFYFGSAVGETGNSATDAVVNSTDVVRVRQNPSGFSQVPLTNPYDINRDKMVNSTDAVIVMQNPSGFSPLQLISPAE